MVKISKEMLHAFPMFFIGTIMEKFIFILNNILLFTAARELVQELLPTFIPRQGLLATFLLCPILSFLILLGLGLAGHLTAGAYTLVLAILAFAALAQRFFLRLPKNIFFEERQSPAPLETRHDPELTFYTKIARLLLGINLIVFLDFFLRGNVYVVDDLSYHMTVVAQWFKDQHLSLAPMNYHAYFPINAELLTLWAILPFGRDGMVFLTGIYWMAMMVWVAGEIVFAVSHEKMPAFFAGAMLLTTSTLVAATHSCCANDLAPVVCILAAFWLIHIGKPNLCREFWAVGLLASLLAGMAVGMRVAYAPACIFIGLFLLFRTRFSTCHLLRMVIFIFGLIISGGFWYIRNYLLTGNPVFPAQVGPFSGPFDLVSQASTRLISKADWSNLHQWVAVVKMITSWPYSYFLVCFAGYILVGYCLIRKYILSDSRKLIFFLMAAGFLATIHFPFLPFSGSYNDPDASLVIDKRYLLCPYLIGIILFFSIILQFPNLLLRRILTGFALVVLFLSGPILTGYIIEGFIWGLFIVILTETRWFLKYYQYCLRRPAIPVAVVSIMLALGYSYWQKQADNRIATFMNKVPADKNVFEAIDHLPDRSRITFFGPDSYQYYPLFGRRYQHEPIACDEQGIAWTPLHLRWQASGKKLKWWDDESETFPSPMQFADRLIKENIQYVLIEKKGTDFPVQYQLLKQASPAKILVESPTFSLWTLIP
jgi:hypothetical protein